jgi:hypothetical protein
LPALQLGTIFRLYRVTLEQFNDVLAQENGMAPGDDACAEVTQEEARAFAQAWQFEWERERSSGRLSSERLVAAGTAGTAEIGTGDDDGGDDVDAVVIHGGGVAAPGPPAEMRAPSKRWYGYVKCVGALEGEAVLTFTCPPEELRGFRDGDKKTNQPSVGPYKFNPVYP